MEENDLHVKSEKYKWNIRKIDFLEVVIVLEEINIEKVKVKVVWDWHKVVNSILLTNKWADRVDEPRVGTVLEILTNIDR